MPNDRDVVSVVFEPSGKASEQVLSYNIEQSFTTLTDAFSIKLWAPDHEKLFDSTFPVTEISILLNGAKILLGRIDSMRIEDEGVIEISGRDYLHVLADGFVDTITAKKGESVEAAILKATIPYGINAIDTSGFNSLRSQLAGVDTYSGTPAKDYTKCKVEDFKTNPNEGVFEYVKRVIGRQGLFMLPSTERTKVGLSVPEYRQTPLHTFRRAKDGKGNNILNGSVERDYSQIPTLVIVHGRAGLAGGKFSKIGQVISVFGDTAISPITKADEIQKHVVPKVDTSRNIRRTDVEPGKLYRPLIIKDTESKTQAELEQFARRQVANRVRKTLNVSYTVAGHSHNGVNYCVDTMARVEDEIGKVFEDLWIESVRHSYDGHTGPTTTVEMWRPFSFEFNE